MAVHELLGGRYRLVEHLGDGGMSVVWQGYDDVLERPVAVKLIAPDLAPDPAVRQRVLREAQSAARLCHPHIASVYDYGESASTGAGQSPYVVMELVAGENLSERLSGGACLPWREATTVCAQVASALAEAHAHGIVHRDVKPGNVVLTPSGAKVVDFGISALVGESDHSAELLGTPAYVAPERLQGRRADPASDVYALGVLLYRSLAGKLPWAAETPTEMLSAHLSVEPAPLPGLRGLPEEVAELCLACLAKDPEDRPRALEAAFVLATAAGIAMPLPLSDRVAGSLERSPDTSALAVATQAAVATQTAVADGSALVPAPTLIERIVGAIRAWAPMRLLQPQHAALGLVVAGALVFATASTWGTDVKSSDAPRATVAAPAQPQVGPSTVRCSVHYQVQRDWRTGFEAALTVRNVGDAPLDDAILIFVFPGGQQIQQGGSGPWRQSGRLVLATVGGSGRPLAPGASTKLPLRGTYQAANPLPLAFFVDDTACEPMVSGVRGTPQTQSVSTGETDNSGRGSGGGGRGHGKDKPEDADD